MLIKKWKEFYEVRPQTHHIIFNDLTTFMFHFSAASPNAFFHFDMERVVSSQITCDTSFELLVLKIMNILKEKVK